MAGGCDAGRAAAGHTPDVELTGRGRWARGPREVSWVRRVKLPNPWCGTPPPPTWSWAMTISKLPQCLGGPRDKANAQIFCVIGGDLPTDGENLTEYLTLAFFFLLFRRQSCLTSHAGPLLKEISAIVGPPRVGGYLAPEPASGTRPGGGFYVWPVVASTERMR